VIASGVDTSVLLQEMELRTRCFGQSLTGRSRSARREPPGRAFLQFGHRRPCSTPGPTPSQRGAPNSPCRRALAAVGSIASTAGSRLKPSHVRAPAGQGVAAPLAGAHLRRPARVKQADEGGLTLAGPLSTFGGKGRARLHPTRAGYVLLDLPDRSRGISAQDLARQPASEAAQGAAGRQRVVGTGIDAARYRPIYSPTVLYPNWPD